MKRVMISLEFNSGAKKLAETGFFFGKALKADITLLHVITGPTYYTLKDHIEIIGFAGQLNVAEEISANSPDQKKTAQLFLNKMNSYLDDKSVRTLLMEGDYAETILTAAKNINADVIIMGSFSRNWIDYTTEQSVIYKVLNDTTIPVLIIPLEVKP